MWFETLRLALGAYLTSPGAAGLAAVAAALVAYHGILTRLAGDRELAAGAAERREEAAREAEAKQRWWQILQWLYDNREVLPLRERLDGLAALEVLVQTQEQSTMLELVSEAMLPDDAAEGTTGPRATAAPVSADVLAAARRQRARLREHRAVLPHGL